MDKFAKLRLTSVIFRAERPISIQAYREMFIELINELVPMDERGHQTMNFGKEYISSYSGQSVNTFAEYENVSIDIFGIDIFGTQSHRSGAGDIVAVIRWKRRTCAAPRSTSVANTKPSQ